MDIEGLKNYGQGLEGVLKTLLKVHKELSYLATLPRGFDLTIRGVEMAKSQDFTMLVEKSLGEVVAIGKSINGHRADVLRIVGEAENAENTGDRDEESRSLTDIINKTVR